MTKPISFTQYLRPDGRKKSVTIEVDNSVAIKAQEILDKGFKFECEELLSGMCSFTIHDPEAERDASIRLHPNASGVRECIVNMITTFDIAEAQHIRKIVTGESNDDDDFDV